MKIETLKMVRVSELFEGQADCWSAFVEEAGQHCSWGDNAFSLVSQSFINVVLDVDTDDVKQRLEQLPADVWVDLEG